MYDVWVAECVPCKVETHHKTQDEAIAAAEDHVFAYHRKVDGKVRGPRKIGHVVQRTITEQSDIDATPPDVQVQTPEVESGDRGEQSAGSDSPVEQIQRATDDFLASLKSEGQ